MNYMRRFSFSFLKTGFSFLLLTILFSLTISSCSRKFRFENSSLAPNAEGQVKVKKDHNKNYAITVKTVNLAEPEKLDPPSSLYVVWMQTEFNGTKNVGQIKTSSGLFSKKLKASISTVSPFKPVQVFITGEENGNVSYPSLQRVLTTGLFRVK